MQGDRIITIILHALHLCSVPSNRLAQVAPLRSDPLQSNRFVSLGPASVHATKRGCIITVILHALHMCSVPSNQLVQVVHSNPIHSSPIQNLGVQQFNLLIVLNHIL
jgi:hypothetical protein